MAAEVSGHYEMVGLLKNTKLKKGNTQWYIWKE